MKTYIFCLVIALCLHTAEGEVIYGKEGQPVKIKCGGPTPDPKLDLEWNFEDDLIRKIKGKSGLLQTGPAYREGKMSVKSNYIELVGVDATFGGSYTCTVGGERMSTHTLHIVKVSASPSDPVEGTNMDLKCLVEGPTPLPSVEWIRPSGQPAGSHSGSFQVEGVAQSDSGDWVCLLSKDGHTHREIQRVDVKNATVTDPSAMSEPPPRPGAGNKPPAGVQPATPCLHCTPGLKPPGRSLLGLGMWMWGAVGAGCMLLVLLVVLVVLLHRRNKRMKRRARKTIRQPLKPNDYCQCKAKRPAGPPQGGPREKPSPAARQHR